MEFQSLTVMGSVAVLGGVLTALLFLLAWVRPGVPMLLTGCGVMAASTFLVSVAYFCRMTELEDKYNEQTYREAISRACHWAFDRGRDIPTLEEMAP